MASTVLAAMLWVDYLFIAGGELGGAPYPVWACLVLVVNLALTVWCPGYKRAVVAVFQKYVLNPPVRLLAYLGVPLGWCLLETTGRRTGRRRVVPVGNGLMGDQFWIVAEHGDRAAYVRNIRADPRVRIRLWRQGRLRWVSGIATVLDGDDPWARQRWLIGWRHPLRALNAMVVQVLGTSQLRTVRVDLEPRAVRAEHHGPGSQDAETAVADVPADIV